MSTCEHAHDDGAYVLGALSPDERLAFEQHLPDCESCARSVRELAGLPGLLSRIPVEVVEAEPAPLPVPDTLLPALVRRARGSRHRRAWVASGLVAAAVLVAGLALGAATLGFDDPDDPDDEPAPSAAATTAAPRAMQPVGDEPLAVSVSLTDVGWGTRLDVTCRYSDKSDGRSDERPAAYAMYVTKTDGSTEQVASWKGLPGKTMKLAAATAASSADIVQVVVRAADGTEVLTYES